MGERLERAGKMIDEGGRVRLLTGHQFYQLVRELDEAWS
jgi:hypothetical protein